MPLSPAHLIVLYSCWGFIFIYVSLCISVSVCQLWEIFLKGQQKVLEASKLGLQVTGSCQAWILGAELKSFRTRLLTAFNSGPISPAPAILLVIISSNGHWLGSYNRADIVSIIMITLSCVFLFSEAFRADSTWQHCTTIFEKIWCYFNNRSKTSLC